MQAKAFLSPADLAHELSISSSTVLRLIHAGELPAIRVSERIYRIPRATVELYKAGALTRPRPAQLMDAGRPRPDLGAGETLPRAPKLAVGSPR